MTDSDTTLTVQNAVPFPTIGQFRLAIENELLLVTSVAANVFTVQRGIEDTVAAAHANFTQILLPITAGALTNLAPAGNIVTAIDSSVVVDRIGNVIYASA